MQFQDPQAEANPNIPQPANQHRWPKFILAAANNINDDITFYGDLDLRPLLPVPIVGSPAYVPHPIQQFQQGSFPDDTSLQPNLNPNPIIKGF